MPEVKSPEDAEMHYLIDARLENGIPQLTIRDADTGRLRLHWARPREGQTAGEALHGLFKELVLLSCADKIGSAEPARVPRLRDESPCPYVRISRSTGLAARKKAPDNIVNLAEWRRVCARDKKR